MNNTMKNAVRLAGVVVGLGAAVWALRDRLLPAPELSDEPAPRFREAEPVAPVPDDDADLTRIKGIGPVTADKLATAGVEGVRALAAMSTVDVAEAAGTSETSAARWIESAKSLG
jgi:predicted flap endonuclease-1-like 5' DNA nuclease